MFFPSSAIETAAYVLLGIFLLSSFGQIVFYLGLFGRIVYKKRVPQLKKYPISVIICARNEAENLKRNLPSILAQKHEDYEVIVVNDCSTDETDIVLGELLKKFPHLKTTSIAPDNKFTHGKKLAVTIGIKAATHEWLVFTDADCHPVSDQWLNRIQENFTDRKHIVLGYGGYERKKGFLNRYIQFDTLVIAIQYLSYAIAGMPYMGVGRNLAYRKSLFYKNKGFASHYGLQSGDDDLFVNETANKKNTAVEFHHESHTLSVPKQNWKEWITQKKRHITTSGRYKSKHIFFLGLEPLLRLLFFISFCYLLLLNIYTTEVLIVFALRSIVQLIIMKLSMIRLKVKGIFLFIPIFDIVSLIINFRIYLSGKLRRKQKTWK